ncbi:MAG: hypothetical protein DRH26_02985 [Deltaproteobacteria bacterium]|nr:MAG: hypothetical protein DRH26_02985 [Deltaproteobacteria bacterium]
MIFFSFKLKQKILSVILFVIFMVMIVSSLVVSYVTYGQNVAATNANLVVGVNNIKNKIQEVRQDLFKKIGQMDTVFKVSENVKFIGEFKKDYDLGMTESAFVDLANAMFATASANNIQKLAVYDAQGELVAFAEQKEEGNLLAGFYYVNPEKTFKTTRIKGTDDLKKSQWETGALISDLDSKLLEPPTTATTPESHLIRQGDHLVLSILVPVMVDDYNKETDKMEPRRFGVVVLSKLLDNAFVAQMAELTGMHVNIFAGETLAAGNLSSYASLKKQGVLLAAPVGWSLETQAAIPGVITVDTNKYFQALLPIYTGSALCGAISVLTSNKTVMENTLQLVYTLVIVYLCCIVLIIPVALFFSGTMVKSLVKVTASLKDVAEGEGDLTQRIRITSKDEIGELSHWFNLFIEKLQNMIQDISKSSQSLSGSVDVTKGASRDISDNSSQMLDTTRTVTQSTHEMSSQITSISGVVGQAADNLDIVASATEEMTATINEIAKNAESARSMSTETKGKIKTASVKVTQLGMDAKEIDGFTASINDISEQTNLLALNATIEAARAGEAGKGFAVVAGEIKELARQTATATQDIKGKIDNIMLSSGDTVTEMGVILKAFGDMNDVVNEIASAIEEQSATTKEIADNTATVAMGINDVNTNITQVDLLTSDIATQMETVNQASGKMSENCTNINKDTQEMGTQTARLDQLINRFKIE